MLSVPSPQPLFAFLAVGAGLAMALAVRRTPMLSAVTAGLLVNAALRLRLPGPVVTELAAAVALLLPVAVSGYRGLR